MMSICNIFQFIFYIFEFIKSKLEKKNESNEYSINENELIKIKIYLLLFIFYLFNSIHIYIPF